MEGSLSFTFNVYPCAVTSFDIAPTSVTPIEYLLGEAGFTFADYSVTQGGGCGYDQTVLVTGLPTSGFITHEENQKNFKLSQTSSTDAVGQYSIKLQISITVPEGFTGERQETVSLDIDISVNPCTVTTFEAISAPIAD